MAVSDVQWFTRKLKLSFWFMHGRCSLTTFYNWLLPKLRKKMSRPT